MVRNELDRPQAVLVKHHDVRLGVPYDDQANREVITCGMGCAAQVAANAGSLIRAATPTGADTAFVPHAGGEPGHGVYLTRLSPKETTKFHKQGAKCASCGRDVG